MLSGGPWNFNNDLLVLEEPKGLGDFSKLKFNRVSFWIQLHQVPLFCMTKEVAIFLGNIIGKLEDVDLGTSGDCLGVPTVDVSLCFRAELQEPQQESLAGTWH